MTFIEDLPKAVMCVIHSFLCNIPTTCATANVQFAHNFLFQFSNARVWSNLLNSTKQFQELKFESLYVSLNSVWSKKYLSDRIFRAFIQSLFLKNTMEQLSLKFVDSVSSWSYVNNLHYLSLEYINELPLDNVHVKFLHLRNCRFSEDSCTIHAEHIAFSQMGEVSFRKVSFTDKLDKLYLFQCRIEAFSSLEKWNTLTVLYVDQCFIHHEDIYICNQAMDKVALEGVHFQNVKICLSVENLTIVTIPAVLPVISSFQITGALKLWNGSLEMLPKLQNVVMLELKNIHGLRKLDVIHFPALKKLTMSDCRHLQQLIVNGKSIALLVLIGKLTALELIDIQIGSSLKRLTIEKLEANKTVKILKGAEIRTITTSGTPVRIVNL
jgi:hypothetical protein